MRNSIWTRRSGLVCTTAVHICYGYGIEANIAWKKSLGSEWRQYEKIFPALNASRFDQVSLECVASRVPLESLKLLPDKDVIAGVIDVASNTIESPDEVADSITRLLDHVPKAHLIPGTNCGMAPMDRAIAIAKLQALGKGAAIARKRHG